MDPSDTTSTNPEQSSSIIDMEFVSIKSEPLDEDFTTLEDFSTRESLEFLPDYNETLARESSITKTEIIEPTQSFENLNQNDEMEIAENSDDWISTLHSSKSTDRPHICNICHKGFRRLQLMQRHMLSHSEVKPYSCLICGNKFSLLKSVRLHLRRIHNNVAPFEANISRPEKGKGGKRKKGATKCNQPETAGSDEMMEEVGSPASEQQQYSDSITEEDSFPVSSESYRKLKKKSQEKKVSSTESKDINCNVCKVSFASKIVYEDHLSSCQISDEETNESSALNNPDIMKTHRRVQYCIECKEFFYYAKHIEFHAEICSSYKNSKLYKLENFKNKCEICNKVYSLKSLTCLKNHMIDIHGFTVGPCEISYKNNKDIDSNNLILQCKSIEESEIKNKSDLKFMIYCITCKKEYPYEYYFKTHLKICLKNYEYVCPFCAVKIMHFNESVMNHISGHLKFKNKIFHCDLCEGSFFTGVNRHLHSINMHSAVEFEPQSSAKNSKTVDSNQSTNVDFELNFENSKQMPTSMKTYVKKENSEQNTHQKGGMITYSKKSKLNITPQNIEISKKVNEIPEIEFLNTTSKKTEIPVVKKLKTYVRKSIIPLKRDMYIDIEAKPEIPRINTTIKTYVKKAKISNIPETQTNIELSRTSNLIMNIELEPETILDADTQVNSTLTNVPEIDTTSSTFELSTLFESCDWEPLNLKFDKYSNIGDEIQSKNESIAPLLFTRNIYNKSGAVELKKTKSSQPKFRKPLKRPKTSTDLSDPNSDTTYVCSTCNENIPKYEFVKHIESHVYLCTFCNKLFLKRSQIKFHLELSTLECAKNYEYLLNDTELLKQLKINFKNTHCNVRKAAYLGKITPFVSYDPANQCSVCGMNYKYQCQLQRHQVLKDHDVGIIQCGLCHLKFSNKAIFDNHTKLHDREISLKCQNCNFMSKEIDDIIRHYDSEHISEEKATKDNSLTPIKSVFECLKCMKVFQSQLEIDGHKDYDHDMFRFECCFCPAQFSKKVFLHQHIAVEHPKVKEMLGDQSV